MRVHQSLAKLKVNHHNRNCYVLNQLTDLISFITVRLRPRSVWDYLRLSACHLLMAGRTTQQSLFWWSWTVGRAGYSAWFLGFLNDTADERVSCTLSPSTRGSKRLLMHSDGTLRRDLSNLNWDLRFFERDSLSLIRKECIFGDYIEYFVLSNRNLNLDCFIFGVCV